MTHSQKKISNKEFKKILIFSIIILAIFFMTNYESINCIIKPNFFIPLEKQEGQIILSELGSINIFSKVVSETTID